MSDAILHFAEELMSSWWISAGVALGIGLALAVTAAVEFIRRTSKPQLESEPDLVKAGER
jgi:hypothetical protein